MTSPVYTPENPKSIQLLFTRIARNYDRTNHVISFGLDILWRKKFSRLFSHRSRVADICCGSGAMIPLLGNRILAGLDFTRAMLKVASSRYPESRLVEGDAQKMPFSSSSFDAAIIVYSIRNIPDLPRALSELYRILQPDGLLGILDFGVPQTRMLESLYLLYFRRIMPFIGGLVAGDKESYRYFVNSVLRFPKRQDFLRLVQAAGFKNSRYIEYMGGAAICYLAEK